MLSAPLYHLSISLVHWSRHRYGGLGLQCHSTRVWMSIIMGVHMEEQPEAIILLNTSLWKWDLMLNNTVIYNNCLWFEAHAWFSRILTENNIGIPHIYRWVLIRTERGGAFDVLFRLPKPYAIYLSYCLLVIFNLFLFSSSICCVSNRKICGSGFLPMYNINKR